MARRWLERLAMTVPGGPSSLPTLAAVVITTAATRHCSVRGSRPTDHLDALWELYQKHPLRRFGGNVPKLSPTHGAVSTVPSCDRKGRKRSVPPPACAPAPALRRIAGVSEAELLAYHERTLGALEAQSSQSLADNIAATLQSLEPTRSEPPPAPAVSWHRPPPPAASFRSTPPTSLLAQRRSVVPRQKGQGKRERAMAGPRWEYRLDDDHKFKPFAAKDASGLEAAYQEGKSACDITAGAQHYEVDLALMVQRNKKTKRQRMIRRIGPDGEATTREPVWEWDTGAGWAQYGLEECRNIERAFASDALRTSIKIPTSAHDIVDVTLHFGHMTQSTAKNPEKQRPIRRTMKLVHESLPNTQEDRKPKAAASPSRAKRPRSDEKESDSAAPPLPPTAASPPKPPSSGAKTVNPVPRASAKETDWTSHHSVLLLRMHEPPSGTVKIAAFDMDDTLVMAKGGRVFGKTRDDWVWLRPSVPAKLQQLHGEGYHLCIVSNQSGIGSDPSKAGPIKGKCWDLSRAAGVPISAAIATGKDEYRKPEVALWKLLVSQLFNDAAVDLAQSFYCGDAAGRSITTLAGRKKDFSCSDRKFAYNCGVTFYTPEELFEGIPPAAFAWGLGPEELAKLPRAYPAGTHHSATKELVVFVGYPGCGKSAFYRRFLAPYGYVQANRDTLKTKEKCVAVAKEALAAGKSVVIDNTNPGADDRKLYVDVARAAGVPARCFYFTAPRELAEHQNVVRQRTGGEHVPGIAYNTFASKFTKPTAKEGFTEVLEVAPAVVFDGLPKSVEDAFFQLS